MRSVLFAALLPVAAWAILTAEDERRASYEHETWRLCDEALLAAGFPPGEVVYPTLSRVCGPIYAARPDGDAPVFHDCAAAVRWITRCEQEPIDLSGFGPCPGDETGATCGCVAETMMPCEVRASALCRWAFPPDAWTRKAAP